MCKYCEEDEVIMEKDIISPRSWGWGYDDTKINLNQTDEDKFVIFVDRGFLRFVDSEDCQCLDHGQKIKIEYCPFCGDKLN
jgi:hypothetical protein